MKKAIIAGTAAVGMALTALPALAGSHHHCKPQDKCGCPEVTVTNKSSKNITNNVGATSNTGGNVATSLWSWFGGGKAKNVTGNADAINSVGNQVYGVDSDVEVDTDKLKSVKVENTSTATLTNNVYANADSGHNVATSSKGTAKNKTGDAWSQNTVTNYVDGVVSKVDIED